MSLLHRGRSRQVSPAAILLLATVATSSPSCESEPDVEAGRALTFEEFEASVYVDPEGVYIVDGDTPIETRDQLREFYEDNVEVRRVNHRLIVNVVNGADDRWPAAEQLDLRYCVSESFGTDYAAVVQGMQAAAAAWEAVADVDFVHVTSADANCSFRTKGVVFDVRPVNTTQYLARAFFPSTSRRNRNVLIAPDALGGNNPTLAGVLRHELGHALGFRHEHTRPESGTCFEDSSWRPLTPYDSASVMHYPQCNGSGDWSLQLTPSDEQGAADLYGSPGSSGGDGDGDGDGDECLATGESCSGDADCCSNKCKGPAHDLTCR